jgi:hypothetical protein
VDDNGRGLRYAAHRTVPQLDSLIIDPMYAGVQTESFRLCSNQDSNQRTEKLMYFGGGILGTILIIALIVYFVRRA